MAYILVMMDSSKHYNNLIPHVEKMPEIVECHAVLGEGSHLLKAIVKNTEALEKVLSRNSIMVGSYSNQNNVCIVNN